MSSYGNTLLMLSCSNCLAFLPYPIQILHHARTPLWGRNHLFKILNKLLEGIFFSVHRIGHISLLSLCCEILYHNSRGTRNSQAPRNIRPSGNRTIDQSEQSNNSLNPSSVVKEHRASRREITYVSSLRLFVPPSPSLPVEPYHAYLALSAPLFIRLSLV